MTQALAACIAACIRCTKHCEHMIQEALKADGLEAQDPCLAAYRDCIEICKLTASLMIRQDSLYPLICLLCAEICKRVVRICPSRPMSVEALQGIEACADCAEQCMQLALSHRSLRASLPSLENFFGAEQAG